MPATSVITVSRGVIASLPHVSRGAKECGVAAVCCSVLQCVAVRSSVLLKSNFCAIVCCGGSVV